MRLRVLLLSILFLPALTLAACGDDGSDEATHLAPQPRQVQDAIESLDRTENAANEGDLEAASAALDDAHDLLHEVIDLVETEDPQLASDINGAVDHLEGDLGTGGSAEHIAGAAEDLRGLLEEAGKTLSE